MGGITQAFSTACADATRHLLRIEELKATLTTVRENAAAMVSSAQAVSRADQSSLVVGVLRTLTINKIYLCLFSFMCASDYLPSLDCTGIVRIDSAQVKTDEVVW